VDLGGGSSSLSCGGVAPLPFQLVRAGWGPQLHRVKSCLATAGAGNFDTFRCHLPIKGVVMVFLGSPLEFIWILLGGLQLRLVDSRVMWLMW
jgi:hypothetical protein